VELGEQRLDEAQLRNMSTVELVRHAFVEMKLLIRAEALHARTELKEELGEARTAGIVLGLVVLALAALLAFLAMRKLPKQPLARTRDRLKLDWMLTREELQ